MLEINGYETATSPDEIIFAGLELKNAMEERGILKKPPCTLPASPSEVHVHRAAPIRTQAQQHVRALNVHRSYYYAWKSAPLSQRALEDAKLEVGLKMLEPSINEACVACAENHQIGLLKGQRHSIDGTDYEGIHRDTNLLGLEREDESGHWCHSRGTT